MGKDWPAQAPEQGLLNGSLGEKMGRAALSCCLGGKVLEGRCSHMYLQGHGALLLGGERGQH